MNRLLSSNDRENLIMQIAVDRYLVLQLKGLQEDIRKVENLLDATKMILDQNITTDAVQVAQTVQSDG